MTTMNAVVLSKCLIVTFVTTVTLWYFVTPYIVQPHKGIISDLLSSVNLKGPSRQRENQNSIRVENWTKWRIYVRGESEDQQVIHRGTSDLVNVSNSKAVMYMEWRPEYEIVVTPKQVGVDTAGSGDSQPWVDVSIVAPLLSFQKWGIYDHFTTEWSNNQGEISLRVLPRFLFGIPIPTVTKMYGVSTTDLLANLPIIGVFSQSTRYDRVIIQAYMNLVTLSVIFLLWANNPPESLLRKPEPEPSKTGNGKPKPENDTTDGGVPESPLMSNGRRRRSSNFTSSQTKSDQVQ